MPNDDYDQEVLVALKRIAAACDKIAENTKVTPANPELYGGGDINKPGE